MASRDIKFQLSVDTKSSSVSVKKIEKDIKDLSKSSDKAMKKTTKSFNKFTDSLKKNKTALVGVGAAIATATVGTAAVLKVTLDAASDMKESVNKSNAIFKSQGASVLKWANDNALAFGLSKQAAIENTATLGNMFKQLGSTAGEAKNSSIAMVELAGDITSFHNVTGGAEEVLNSIAAAFRGEYDSLQKYIPTINAAAVQHEALAMTGKKSAKELTALEKALAAQRIIVRDAGDAIGDAAKTQGDYASQTRKMENQIKNFKVTLGEQLLPVATKWVTELTTWVEKNDELIGQKVELTIDKMSTALKSGADQAQRLWDIISYDPAILKYGLLGLAAGGTKGAVIVGGLAHTTKAFYNMGKGIEYVKQGFLSFSDLATSDFKELDDHIKRIEEGMAKFSEEKPLIKEKKMTVTAKGPSEEGLAKAAAHFKMMEELWAEQDKMVASMDPSDLFDFEGMAVELQAHIEDKAERILVLEQETIRNTIRLQYEGLEEFIKLKEYELEISKTTGDERVALEKRIQSEIALAIQAQQKQQEGLDASAGIRGVSDTLDKWLSEESKTIPLGEGDKEFLADLKKTAETTEEVWKKTLDSIQSSFADVFGDAMRGELDSFEDYFDAFMNNLTDIAADYLAEMLADWIKNLAAKEVVTKASESKGGDKEDESGVSGVSNVSGGAMSVVIGAVQLISDWSKSGEERDKRREETELAVKEAYDAVQKALEKNSDALDRQLSVRHSWSDNMDTVLENFKAALDAVREIAPLQMKQYLEEEEEGVSQSHYELAITATMNYFKEFALIVKSINESMEDFEESIEALNMTAYESMLSKIDSYYDDISLASSEVALYKIQVQQQIDEYQAQLDKGTLASPWDAYEETVQMSDAEIETTKKAIAALKDILATYATVDVESSEEKALESMEEYYSDLRNEIKEGVSSYMDDITDSLGSMTAALKSTDEKFQALQDTMEDMGASTKELDILQKQWLKALKAVAESKIFDMFEDELEDLALLRANVAGQSTSDYYLEKYQDAMDESSWIYASEFIEEWYQAQIKVSDLWDSVTSNVQTLIDNIQAVIDSIKYSSLNVALPTEKAEEAALDYAQLKAAALTGGTAEIEEFVSFASTYLQTSQDVMKSSEEYQQVYAEVMADLVSFQEELLAGNYDQLIYNELADMNTEINENLVLIGDNLEEYIAEIRASFESKFTAERYASFARGGIASGPSSGYLAELHGEEAVIPLEGGSIPIRQRPMNVHVYVGNEELESFVVQHADNVRVKANRRPGNLTKRIY